MRFYEFDQEGLGKYMESNTRSNRTSDSRVDEISHAVKKSLVAEAVFAVGTTLLEVIFHNTLFLIPAYVAIIWGYIWCVTTLRAYFGITGMWRVGILKEERIMAFRKMGKLWLIHILLVLYLIINIGWYLREEDPRYGVTILIISIGLTGISYALGYATGNPKQRRWWEFSNYNETPDYRA